MAMSERLTPLDIDRGMHGRLPEEEQEAWDQQCEIDPFDTDAVLEAVLSVRNRNEAQK